MITSETPFEKFHLNDGDVAQVYKISNMIGGYSRVYRNSDTLAIDHIFGLDGSYLLKDQPMGFSLISAVSGGSLGDSQVESTLGYFIQLAVDTYGVIVGIEENELSRQCTIDDTLPFMKKMESMEKSKPRMQWLEQDSLLHRIHINKAIEEGYLVRKIVDGENVLFPANIFPRGN